MESEPTVFDRLIMIWTSAQKNQQRLYFSELIRLLRYLLAGTIERWNIANGLFDQIFDLGRVDFDSGAHRRRQSDTFQVSTFAGSRLET